MGAIDRVALPAVLGAELVESVNPCAFALLLVVVATMLTIMQRRELSERAARGWLVSHGGIYIAGIFVTYLALGLGLLGALHFAKELSNTYGVSRVAPVIAIGLGLLAFQEALPLEFGSRLSTHADTPQLRGLVSRLRFPGLFIAGVLVGLCTVPCAGSVYLAILALLSRQATMLKGVVYLVLYNAAFIAPLFIVLRLASSPAVYRRLEMATSATWDAQVQHRHRGGRVRSADPRRGLGIAWSAHGRPSRRPLNRLHPVTFASRRGNGGPDSSAYHQARLRA